MSRPKDFFYLKNIKIKKNAFFVIFICGACKNRILYINYLLN